MLSRLKPLLFANAGVSAPSCLAVCCRDIRRHVGTARKPQAKALPPDSPGDSAAGRPQSPPTPGPAPSRFPLADASQALSTESPQQLQRLQQNQWLPVDRDAASPSVYLALAKSRLTLLVVATAAAGYAMAPGQLDPVTLAACLAGTALTSASANTINQLLEIPYDSQMVRTRARPLVSGRVSPVIAAAFAAVSGVSGVGLLAGLANPVSAALAAANLLLYCGAYTPAKRRTVANTAIGALVGAVPPLIGWSAATGGSLGLGGLLLALLMFHWQFPHFHALSWSLRDDYSRAGYCMASVLDPARCRRSALINSFAFSAVCYGMTVCGVTSWFFLVDSLPFNLALLYLSGIFFWYGDSSSGRRLFQFSLINLPIIFVLMLISRTPDSERERVGHQNMALQHSFFRHS